jgi:hypothetical protein
VHEYVCDAGHKFERLFLTFKAAEKETKETLCDVCFTNVAERVISAPGMPIIYGEGAHRPAASGAHSYTRRDVTKVLVEENIQTPTTDSGEKFGVKHLEKAKRISKQIRKRRG